MTRPDIQYFDHDGTWVKPPGAERVEITIKGGEASTAPAVLYARAGYGSGGRGGSGSAPVSAGGYAPTMVPGLGRSAPATEPETVTESFAADDLPDLVSVEIGKGGRPGGRDGYVLVVTHLTDEGERLASDERIQAYGRGELSGDQLTGDELEQATDGLDALDWA